MRSAFALGVGWFELSLGQTQPECDYMTKLFDQQQLSDGVREFEQHLRRASAPDWTVDRQSAKPVNAQPARAVVGDRREAIPGRGKPPMGRSSGKLTSRSLLLALGALVLTVFVGAMVATLPDWSALFAEKDSAAFEPETQAITPAREQAIAPALEQAIAPALENDAAQPVGSASSAAPSKAPLDGLAAAPATSEVYVSTIRPDGSLAPDTTPHVDLVAPADPTPQAAAAPPPPVSVPAPAAAPAADSTTAPPPTAEQTGGAAPAVATTTDAPGEKNPPAAKPAKKRTATHAANPAAKPTAAKPGATAAAKPADDARQPAPAAADVDGIFQSAQRAVGSLTGAVKKLVGAD